jgi:hypothetical protein
VSNEEPTGKSEPLDGRSSKNDDDLSFSEVFSSVLGRAGFATVKPGQMPSSNDLLAAVGGVRGLIESVLPSFGFLVLFAVTHDLLVSVLAPVAVAVGFIIARAIQRQPVRTAVVGAVITAATAVLAIVTGKPEDNFLPGIITNAVSLAAILVSLVARWPIVGIFVGALSNDLTGWRADAGKRRVMTVATWMWAGLFALRLIVQVPLYLNGQAEWLAGAKLILGVPLYATLLWITWRLVGTVFSAAPPSDRSEHASSDGIEPRN